jgi:hypothetical protein
LEGLKQRHNLPAEFDVERPANLAPACGGCNNEKGARLLGEFQLDLRLGKAAEYAPEVIANVLAYVTSGKVSRYLRVIRAADLTDPATRTAFERDAPGVVQSLALLDEGKADFLAPRPVDLSDLGYPGLVVAVSVNARGRAALAVLEGICRASLHDALELAVDDLVKQICDRTRVVLGSVGINAGRPLTAGEPECDWLRVSVDSMDFARAAADLLLTSDGSFEGRLTTPVRDTGYLGGTTSEIEVAGRFQLGAAWPIATAAGSPQSRTCQITQWSNGVVMTY